MSALASIADLDLSAEIAALPKMPGFVTPAARGREQYITLHYSGVDGKRYADRSRAAELARIIAEAREHLRRDWSSTGRGRIYGDGYMYDWVVLSDGGIVRTRGRRQQLWHCGNGDGNERSWSVHVLLGRGQDLTAPQRLSLFRLFDALRAETGLARSRVVGHNEWPRVEGLPQPASRYRTLFGQSECPGPVLHAHLAAYRALSDQPAQGAYTADSPLMGPSRVTAAQVIADILRRPHGDYTEVDIRLIVGEYERLCHLLGLDLGVAAAQLAHETGTLTSWWAARPRRNPAGLGVTGHTVESDLTRPPGSLRAWARDVGRWREGLSFTAWRDEDAPDGEGAISHHLGRLLAYALPTGAGTELQRRYINRALALRPLARRGHAPTLAGLVGTWAFPGWKLVGGTRVTYAERLAARAEQIRSTRP